MTFPAVFRCALFVLLSAAILTPGHAGLRVLITFDRSGHKIEQIVQVPAEADGDNGAQVRSVDRPVEDLSIRARQPVVNWFDASGNLIDSQYLSDPRIAHAPMDTSAVPGSQGNPHYVLRPFGTYLLVGPDAANEVRVILPEATTASVAIDVRDRPVTTWIFDLSR